MHCDTACALSLDWTHAAEMSHIQLAQNHLCCLNSKSRRPLLRREWQDLLQTQLLHYMPPDPPAVLQSIQQGPMKHQENENLQS